MVFYESPYRVVKLLTQLADAFGGDRQASVSREISKLHEETLRVLSVSLWPTSTRQHPGESSWLSWPDATVRGERTRRPPERKMMSPERQS